MKRPPFHVMRTVLVLVFGAGLLSGCAYKIIPPETVTVNRAPDDEPHTYTYPMRIIVHDEEAFWDAHQIKDNLVGLVEFELVRAVDILVDVPTPGPERRPVEHSIEWIKNRYARLPDSAPKTIVGEFFRALGLEKISPGRGYSFFPRFVYLTEWLQICAGELNRFGGHAVPRHETLIPKSWTAGPDRAIDWAQNGLIGVYIFVFQKLNWIVDESIDGGESAWKAAVWLVARSRHCLLPAAPAGFTPVGSCTETVRDP